MAAYLTTAVEEAAHGFSSGSGLKRSQSSILLSSSSSHKTSKSSRRPKREHVAPKRSRSKPAPSPPQTGLRTSRSNTSLVEQGQGGLRRSGSESSISSMKKGRPLKVDTFDLLPILSHEQSQAPPSSPLVVSPPSDESPGTDAVAPILEIVVKASDDTLLKQEPTMHVDYLSYDWREEDLWKSWRYVSTRRNIYGERSRLENALFRTWGKKFGNLGQVTPDSLNWMKDCDVTWLYGPLSAANQYVISPEPLKQNPLSKTNSFLQKKPILKKRSMSEMMLQRSLSTSSLVREAAAVVQAQQNLGKTPALNERRNSDFTPDMFSPKALSSRDATDYFSSQSTSGLATPFEGAEKKHIRFDDKVEQCIAVEVKGDFEDEDEELPWYKREQDSDDEAAGYLMMKRSKKKRPLLTRERSSRRNSGGSETKIIEKLPSTTLKYRTDSPDVTEEKVSTLGLASYGKKNRLSPSPSVETLRPSNPSKNFLLPDEDEAAEDPDWVTGGDEAMPARVDEEDILRAAYEQGSVEGETGMRRTASGMLMPLDGEDGAAPGILGRVLDTVNTAKDIAHVIWNVGRRP